VEGRLPESAPAAATAAKVLLPTSAAWAVRRETRTATVANGITAERSHEKGMEPRREATEQLVERINVAGHVDAHQVFVGHATLSEYARGRPPRHAPPQKTA